MNNKWSDIFAKRSPLKKMSASRRNVSKKRTNKDAAEELSEAPTAKRTNKNRALPALKFLDSQINKNKLVDLHTHLMGTGNARFWVDDVMKNQLEAIVDRKKVERWTKPSTKSFVDCLSTDKIPLRKLPPIFNYDVVFSIEKLAQTLKVTSTGTHCEVDVIGKLNHGKNNDMHISDMISDYTVWNARTQEKEIRRGITRTHLLKLMQDNPHVDQTIRDAFEMRFDGLISDASIFLLFRNNFGTEFYPARFALKDDIYSQYPEILDELIKWNVLRYRTNGVRYVEFSVGVGDVTTPWIWRHLVKATCQDDVDENDRVKVRYLAGFGRHLLKSPLLLDVNMDTFGSVKECINRSTDGFEKHLAQLKNLESFMKECRESQIFLGLHSHLVGLDFLGDEFLRPYCPFNTQPFLSFLSFERNLRQGHFGFRYHCGECQEFEGADDIPGWLTNHMAVSSAVILDILVHLKKVEDNYPTPALRIGHGNAFGHWIRNDSATDALAFTTPSHIIIAAFQAIIKFHIPVEINVTSNDLLMNQEMNNFCLFKQKQTRMAISTDNDGIWCCEYSVGTKKYESIASLYVRVIMAQDSSESKQLDNDYVANLVASSHSSSFDIQTNEDDEHYSVPMKTTKCDYLDEWEKKCSDGIESQVEGT
jgi:hypothetical protein